MSDSDKTIKDKKIKAFDLLQKLNELERQKNELARQYQELVLEIKAEET